MKMLGNFVDHDVFTDYLESSCWADNLANDGGMKFTSKMHYTDIPYNPAQIQITPVDEYNATTGLVIV